MGRNKTAKEIMDRKLTIVFCRENRISEIINVLRTNNNHSLWDKTKERWSFADWNEYFKLKSQHEQIKKCIA